MGSKGGGGVGLSRDAKSMSIQQQSISHPYLNTPQKIVSEMSQKSNDAVVGGGGLGKYNKKQSMGSELVNHNSYISNIKVGSQSTINISS